MARISQILFTLPRQVLVHTACLARITCSACGRERPKMLVRKKTDDMLAHFKLDGEQLDPVQIFSLIEIIRNPWGLK